MRKTRLTGVNIVKRNTRGINGSDREPRKFGEIPVLLCPKLQSGYTGEIKKIRGLRERQYFLVSICKASDLWDVLKNLYRNSGAPDLLPSVLNSF